MKALHPPVPFIFLANVPNWSPQGLQAQNINLLDIGETPFTTIIHELMHSTAIANPLVGHGVVDGLPANNIDAVLRLALAGSQGALNNPETFSFLALGR